VFRVGDIIVVKDPEIVLEMTDALCTHGLSTSLHHTVALEGGVDPRALGLSKDSSHAYLQCVDPGEPYTDSGTVIFRCRRVGARRKGAVRE